jgi:hypothetical protein
MPRTLNEILVDVNSYVDLEASAPSGDELNTRVNYANQAIWDAVGTYQFSEFDRVYEVNPAANASISLPTGFREFKINPKQLVGGTWVDFPEIDPHERYNKGSSDKYCYVLGNPRIGYTTVFNNLEANCTLSFTYQAFPSGFATLSDICELPDPSYVVAKTESYVLQARGDEKFPYVDAIADRKLKNLVSRDMKSPGGQYRVSPAGFRNPLA